MIDLQRRPELPAIREEQARFQEAIRAYRNEEIDAAAFRPIRLRNGLFFQGEATMLRVAIPGGRLTSGQARELARLARRYAEGGGRWTVRQNFQLYQPSLAELPELIGELAEVGLTTLQTSGPVIRAITTDPLAGSAEDEVDDPRPWCTLLHSWSTLHPHFLGLPSKFKIALTARCYDQIATRAHDIGLRLVEGGGPQALFEVWVGGGLGREPRLADRLLEAVPGSELLAYLEAILRVYSREGHQQDRRVRLKSLLAQQGIDAFRKAVEAERLRVSASELIVDDLRYRAAAALQPETPGRVSVKGEAELARWAAAEPALAQWLRWNVEPQRQAGLRAVTLPLSGLLSLGTGQVSSDHLEMLAALAERYGGAELRATQRQNLLLPHVPVGELGSLWQVLAAQGLAKPFVATPSETVSCPGSERCELANAATTPMVQAIQDHLAEEGSEEEIATPLRVAVSGCMNGCSHHAISEIGLRGVRKRGGSWYQLQLGGSPDGDLAIGTVVGPAIPGSMVPAAVQAILTRYRELRAHPRESLTETLRRHGARPFRQAVHGCWQATAGSRVSGWAEREPDL
ncbi:MAG: nitrite/sulfite reductase [Halorhodospira sp.]